ncbi:hypothetical protein [Virgibacillus ndiopensis]|uniref:hypothetical protein n=1 Tax=Virgibacillus ndiopensis TaxID=2004408 RepID=UPI000C079BBF|nr:hypothetical protein [Virgibacillus ndiopensis]
MCNNIVHFPNNEEFPKGSDEMLIKEIHGLISLFQNPDLSKKTREAIFSEIIDLTTRLTDQI